MNCDHIQPEIKVLAKLAGAIRSFQIPVRGRDHPNVHFDFVVAADRTHFLLLQETQKFGLHLLRQFSNFIQEDSAVVGGLEKSRLRAQRPGKSSLLVSEQFALDQSWDQRPAIDCDKLPTGKDSAE